MKPSADFLTTTIEYLKLEKFKYNKSEDYYVKKLNKQYTILIQFYNLDTTCCVVTIFLDGEIYNESNDIFNLKDLKKEIKSISKYYTLKKYKFTYESEAIDKLDFYRKFEKEAKYLDYITLVK